MNKMNRGYYNSESPGFQYTATGDSSSGGGSGSGMECLQLRSPPAPFHYLLSEQAKSLVALQELQNEVGALLEFRDLVIETFPNLRSKLSQGGQLVSGGTGVGSAGRRDWEPGVRVRRKVPTREADSLPRSRSDSQSKPQTKSESAHSVVQDSGFSTETSSSKEAHSTAAPPTRQPSTYEGELWQLLDVIQHRGIKLKEEAEALRGTLGDRRALSLNALCEQERDEDTDPSGDFQRALGVDTAQELMALRRERDLLLVRLAELEAEALAGRVEAERLRGEHTLVTPTTLRLHDHEDRTLEFRSRPSAPGPLRSPLTTSRNSVFTVVTPVNSTPETPKRVRSTSGLVVDGGDECDRLDCNELGKLDNVLNTPVRNLKVKTPDSRKIAAILREHNPLELQRHLLAFTVQNQLLQSRLDTEGRTKGNLVEKLHRTREENDDLRFQLEEKTIELEGTKAQMRMIEGSSRNSSAESGLTGPRSMRALQPLPLHLQSDDEADHDHDHEHDRITDTPRKRPSKIPLPPSKLPVSGFAPEPPTGRSKDTPSYRSRSGDSLGRPGSAQSWRNKADGSSLTGSRSGNSISSTKSPGGVKNSSFITLKSNSRDSLTRSHNYNCKSSKDSLTGKVRNNDSLSRIRDSNLSSSTSVISKSSKKETSPVGNVCLVNGKKSAVPVRRASSGSNVKIAEGDTKINESLEPRHRGTKWANIPNKEAFHDSLLSNYLQQHNHIDPGLLEDFIARSDQLARDKRLFYLSSRYFHSKCETVTKKEQFELAYQSPNSMKLQMNTFNMPDNKLTTMDVNILHNSPTRSDILFFNEPVARSCKSLWSREPHQYFDSLSHTNNTPDNLTCSNLHSVTNDSIKREGLAECDSLERHIVSFDDI